MPTNRSFITLPRFRRRQTEPAEFLYEGGGVFIYKKFGEVHLETLSDNWSSELEDLMIRFNVGYLWPRVSHIGPRMFEFLRRHKPLRGLTFLSYEALDLRAVADLKQLRHLTINWKHEYPPNYEMDFSKLSLESCHLQLFPQFASILDCAMIRSLSVDFDHIIKCKSLDCSRLHRLCELRIWGPTKLTAFQIHPEAQLTALQISSCARLTVDWPRVGRDLIHVSLTGRIGFPIADIVFAKKLRTVILSRMKSENLDLTFLAKLPLLNAVDIDPPKLDSRNDRIVREINEAGGHGPELFTKVGTYEQSFV